MYHAGQSDNQHGTYSVCIRDGHRFRLHYQDGRRRPSYRDAGHLAQYAEEQLHQRYGSWPARPRVLCYTRIDASKRNEREWGLIWSALRGLLRLRVDDTYTEIPYTTTSHKERKRPSKTSGNHNSATPVPSAQNDSQGDTSSGIGSNDAVVGNGLAKGPPSRKQEAI